MPKSLTGEAKAEWKRTTADLARRGLLDRADRGVLARYCRWSARWIELDALLADEYTVDGARGNLVTNPLFRQLARVDERVLALQKELGLSPASRLRMGPPPLQEDDQDDELARLRKRRNIGGPDR